MVESTQIQTQQTIHSGGGTLTRRHIIATVQEQDLYKTSEVVGTLLTVEYDDEVPSINAAMPTLSNSEIAVLFLKQSGSSYVFSDPYMGVRRFASIPPQRGELGLAKLESALAAVLQQGSSDDQIRAIRLLEGFDQLRPATIAQLVSISASGDSEMALSAIAALLKASPTAGVQCLSNYLRDYQGDEHHIAFMSISAELGEMSDPGAEPGLESLLSSKFGSVRFGAIEAVRRLGSLNSAPALTQRLDDPNADIRLQAVLTLSELFRKEGDYAPSVKAFDENPSFYTNLWKSWWTQGGGKSLIPGTH